MVLYTLRYDRLIWTVFLTPLDCAACVRGKVERIGLDRERKLAVAMIVAFTSDIQTWVVHLTSALWWDFDGLKQLAGVSSSTLV